MVMDATVRTRTHSGRVLLIVLIVAVLSIGLGAGIGAVWMGRAEKPGGQSRAGAQTPTAGHRQEAPATIYSLGEIVVNLADPGTMRYAKITAAVGLAEKTDDDKLKQLAPVLRVAVIAILTNKRFEDLHRPGGLDLLKSELRDEFARRLPGCTVVEVYLEGFGMQ